MLTNLVPSYSSSPFRFHFRFPIRRQLFVLSFVFYRISIGKARNENNSICFELISFSLLLLFSALDEHSVRSLSVVLLYEFVYFEFFISREQHREAELNCTIVDS